MSILYHVMGFLRSHHMCLIICDVARWFVEGGDFAYDSNFEFYIYSVRTYSQLQNVTLFIEIDQRNLVLWMKYCWEFLLFSSFLAACFYLFLENISVAKIPPP